VAARATATKPTRERRNTNPAPAAKAPPAPVVTMPRLYTVDELAEIFHCSTRTIRRMWDEGQLEAVKIRGQRFTRAADLDRFLRDAS
jgi:excisionase family DNA binding protein